MRSFSLLPSLFGLISTLICTTPGFAAENIYPWQQGSESIETVSNRISPPPGYVRTDVEYGSFASWLRHLPLKPEGSPVLLHNGRLKIFQQVHHAVVDIDAGTENLQQCADAVIRLRAEYLYSKQLYKNVHFNFTSGDKAAWSQWSSGYRPIVKGNKVRWSKKASYDDSYPGFRRYLDTVFTYAGTYSLSKELKTKRQLQSMKIGDVFIKGGFPGHAVLVVDMAEDPHTGEKLFLLSQSYMPAQDIHILKNDVEPELSPWYRIPDGPEFRTPEWTFKKIQLKSFPALPRDQRVSRDHEGA